MHMRMMMLCLLSSLVFLAGCKSSKSTVSKKRTNTKRSVNSDGIVKSEDIQSLKSLMVGHFENKAINGDSSTVDVSLRIVPIWEGKEGHFLYAEQFATALPSHPQLQQIYKIESDNNGGFVSNIYKLPNPEQAIGQWKTPTYFNKFSIDDLIASEGCTLYIIRHGDGSFSGSTRMDECKSNVDNAAYTTSTIKLRNGSFMNWEKGFDDGGNQIWGKELGSSVFKRVNIN